MNVWDHENLFYQRSAPDRLLKTLALYDIFKLSLGLPGDIVELGVFKGTSLIKLATFRSSFEASSSRKIIGFDSFGVFPSSDDESQEDKAFIKKFSSEGGEGVSKLELYELLERKGFSNVDLVEGDINESLARWLEENKEKRFSLIHLDLDVYVPTKNALDLLWSRLVQGGVLVVDDFARVLGATIAFETYKGSLGSLRSTQHNASPSYLIKA